MIGQLRSLNDEWSAFCIFIIQMLSFLYRASFGSCKWDSSLQFKNRIWLCSSMSYLILEVVELSSLQLVSSSNWVLSCTAFIHTIWNSSPSGFQGSSPCWKFIYPNIWQTISFPGFNCTQISHTVWYVYWEIF